MELNLLGLFRSGTNFTRSVLEWNYDVEIFYDAYGWKHTVVPTFTRTSSFKYPKGGLLVVVKNPYSTLRSWFSYARKNGRNLRCNTDTFGQFLSHPIIFFDEGNPGISPEYYYSSPIQMWNGVVWNHLSVADQLGGSVVDYDMMLIDPETCCDRIARIQGFTRTSQEFTVPEQVTVNMNDAMRPAEKSAYTLKRKFDKSYFTEKQYLQDFSEEDMSWVSRELDARLLKRLAKRPLVSNDWADVG